MHDLPSLPPGGALRLLAIAGSISLAAFVAAVVIEFATRRWRDGVWALAPLLLGVATMLLGHWHPALHATMSFLTLALALRNAVFFRGPSRWFEVLAIVGWIVALLAARSIFG